MTRRQRNVPVNIPTHRHYRGLPPLLPRGRRYPRGSSIYRAVTIYTVSKMPAFGILVIRTSDRGGATAVKEWNTIRSTSRARVLHSRSEAPGPGVAGIMNETAQSRFSVRAPGLRVCEREGSVEALQEQLNGTERKKFVWSFFEGNNKNASPRPRRRSHRRRRHFDLLCAQVAASQAVTHPAGFLRIEKGATMEDARRPERRWLVSSWKTTHARTAIYAISFEGATGGPSPVNNATLRGGAEGLACFSMDVNDRRPHAIGRDRPLGPLYQAIFLYRTLAYPAWKFVEIVRYRIPSRRRILKFSPHRQPERWCNFSFNNKSSTQCEEEWMALILCPMCLHRRDFTLGVDHKRVNMNARTTSRPISEERRHGGSRSITLRIQNPTSIHRSRRWHFDRARVACLVRHVKRPFFFRNTGTGTSLTGPPSALALTRHTSPQRPDTYAAFHRRHFTNTWLKIHPPMLVVLCPHRRPACSSNL